MPNYDVAVREITAWMVGNQEAAVRLQAVLDALLTHPGKEIVFGCPDCQYVYKPVSENGADSDIDCGVPFHSLPLTRQVCPGMGKIPKMTPRK